MTAPFRLPLFRRPAFWLFAALATTCVLYASVARGIWLDEFWSLQIARHDAPLARIIIDRWLGEANPPLSNLIYWLVASTRLDTIAAQRLVVNGAALAFLVGGLSILRRRDDDLDSRFALTLFVLVVSLQAWVTGASELRIYGWLMAATAVAASYVRSLLVAPDVPRASAIAVGGSAVVLATSLHYVAGLVVSLFLAVAVLVLVVERRFAQTLAIAAPAAVGLVPTAVFGVIFVARSRETLDYAFIVGTPWAAIMLIAVMLVTTLLTNPVAAFMAFKAHATRAATRHGSFAGVCAIAIALAPPLLVAAHFVRPVVVERYLAGWQVLVCALVAHLVASTTSRNRLLDAAMLAVGALMMLLNTVEVARDGGWREGADRVAAQVRACPAARIFAMSPWRLQKARRTRVANAESELIAQSYRRLAKERGLSVDVLDLDTPVTLPIGPVCPTLLWVEHLDPDYIRDVAYVQRAGRIVFAHPARLRIVPGSAGFMLIAEPLQKRREMPR